MSGIIKSIGKVLISPIASVIGGKVGKVIRKIAIGAIAVGAVALTGGAALGILPSLGTMVGGLGLSAGLTTALTGAISSGAVGAVGGLLTGGFKGMTKGLLIGAATGGVMGGLGMLGPNGLIGGGKAVASGIAPTASSTLSSVGPSFANATLAAPTTASALGLAAPGGLAAAAPSFAAAAPAVAGTISPVASALPNVAGAAGGILPSGIANNPLLMSQLLGGVSQAFAPNEYKQKASAEVEARQQLGFGAYGGGDVNGKAKGGIMPGVYSGQSDPFRLQSYANPPQIGAENYYKPPTTRWAYNPTTNTVEEVPAG